MPSDGIKLSSNAQEGLIEKLEGGLDLGYLRYIEKPLGVETNVTYYAKGTPQSKDGKFDTAIRMINGGIALDTIPQVHFLALKFSKDEVLKVLDEVAGNIKDILPYFKDVPTSWEFYQKEIKTLTKIHEAAEKIKKREFKEEYAKLCSTQ